MTSWVSDKFDYLKDNEKFYFPYIYSWIWVGISFSWLGVGGCDLFLAGCVCRGGVSPFFGWVWLGVGRYDLFLAGCGCVLTFFLGGCGWVWMSAWFITAPFKSLLLRLLFSISALQKAWSKFFSLTVCLINMKLNVSIYHFLHKSRNFRNLVWLYIDIFF